MELNVGRKMLESKQKSMQANQERYSTERQMVERNPDRYDIDEWNEKFAMPFLQTGEYPEGQLPIKAKMAESYFADLSRKFTGDYDSVIDVSSIDGVPHKKTTSFNMSVADADKIIEQSIYSDEGLRKDVQQRFAKLPDNEKERWLSEPNGVMRWAQDEFRSTLRKQSQSATTSVTRPRTDTGFSWNVAIGANNNLNDQYDILPSRKLENTELGNYVNLGARSFTSDPQHIGQYLDLRTGEWRTADKSTTFEVVGYSIDKDLLIVKIKSRVSGLPADRDIGLKASLYDDLLKRRPFGIDRKSLRGGGEALKQTPWSK